MKNFKKYILSVVFIALCGEMYFYPYQDNFRFSAGVLAISLILLYYEEIKEVQLGILSGLTIFFFRAIINSLNHEASLPSLLAMDLPAAVYYLVFPVLAYIFSLKKHRDNPTRTIATLFSMDLLSNLLESLLRQDLNPGLFQYMIVIGVFRSIFSYLIYTVLHRQDILLLKKEHQKRYAQQNTLLSNIQAEMFYLNKSMKDIEDVMGKSYKLYEENKDQPELRELALDIAREVHEIKKDYYRVLGGFKEFLQDFGENDSMTFKDISIIIQENISRYLAQNKKEPRISFKIKDNISIEKFYPIFTIVNNLLINSIDASEADSKIQVIERVEDERLIITVVDEGEGMDEETLDLIFKPGFTSKFDDETGVASTGIGLSHVENIVEDLKGSIKIESELGKGTEISIGLPLEFLKG